MTQLQDLTSLETPIVQPSVSELVALGSLLVSGGKIGPDSS